METVAHIKTFDDIGITVADLDVVTAFFVGLGLDVESRTFVEGEFLDTVCGIPDSTHRDRDAAAARRRNAATTVELRPAGSRSRITRRDGQRAGPAQRVLRGR
jgi:hypothetical protein